MALRAIARWVSVCVAAVSFLTWNTIATTEQVADRGVVENAYRANNVGVGWLEQFNYQKAAAQFQEALRLNPTLGIARFNLALAYFYDSQPDAAEREARAAARLMPAAPQPQYLLGLIARAQNRVADAAAAFGRVLQADGADVGANIGLGQIRLQQGDTAGAVAAFQRAADAEPSNATAAYNLSISLTRTGRVDEGRRMLERFQELRASGTATTLGNAYLQQGQYAEALVSTGNEPDLVVPGAPAAHFGESDLGPPARVRTAARPSGGAAALEGGVAAIDVDQDGDLDIVEIAPEHERLWRNDGRGAFTAGAAAPFLTVRGSIGIGAVAGDLTNDGRPDLLVLRQHGTAVYRSEGGGKFVDVTAASGIRLGDDLPGSAALVDADHDGDLDVFIGGLVTLAAPGTNDARRFPDEFPAASARLLRNDGSGRFSDVTRASAIAARRIVAIVPTDYDERRDVDLLTLSTAGPPALFRNLRDGSFADATRSAGFADAGRWTSVAAGDLNKDGRTDFFFGRADGAGAFGLSAAAGRFRIQPAPAPTSGTRASLFLDYDNDGLLDLLVSTENGTRLLRNLGTTWLDVTDRALPAARAAAVLPATSGGRAWFAADVDGDGDTDVVLRYGGRLHVWRNEGGSSQPSFSMRLAGRVSNRSGVGTKIELRAGSLRERRETTAVTPPTGPADLVFGLGAHRKVDAVRLLWPSGILQAELSPGEGARPAIVTELDRKPSSCPFLFTWNGRAFEFISDFLGGGELGYWVAPGVRGTPDSDEVVRVPGDRMVARDGRYELRVTNELEEVLYLDAVRLHVVDHAEDVDVFPDEGLAAKPRPGMRLVAVRALRVPAMATDDRGVDVTRLIAAQDFRAPEGFPLAPIRGYAQPHALTMSRRPGNSADWLVLTGWTDYAYSSDNVAASQAGLELTAPILEVRDGSGRWRTAPVEVPVPAGRPQTVLVDLRRARASHATQFRLRTNMRIHWDHVRFAAAADDARLDVRELPTTSARLVARGFSRERRVSAAGPPLYDYAVVSRGSPWKQFIGASTAEGSVSAELQRIDDRFVVAVAGDEIAVSFDARSFAPPAAGRTRTFFLYADGFSKEMDVHSASPDTIGPLPLHSMRAYPGPERREGCSAGDCEAASQPSRLVTRPVQSLDAWLTRGQDDAGPRTNTTTTQR